MRKSQLKRLEELEKVTHGGLGLVHITLDGADRQLPFYDVMDLCFNPEYLKKHDLIIHDVEERGAALLESIRQMTMAANDQ